MRLPRVATDADSSAAGRQLAGGFRLLRFEADLEYGFRRALRDRWSPVGPAVYGTACLAMAVLLVRLDATAGVALATLLIPAAFLLPGVRWRPALALAFGSLALFWGTYLWRETGRMPSTAALAWTHALLLLMAAVQGYLREHWTRRAYLQALVINHLGERDALTELANRHMFDRYLDGIWRQSIEDKALLVLLLVDVDRFREYNDRQGLAAGDDCLRKVARAVAASATRPLDFCARYGGVQFAVLLANPDRLYAEDLPARVRSAVAALAIAHPDSPNGRTVTVSVGVALTVPRAADSREDFLGLAHAALREARQAGGNRIAAREAESSLVRTGMFRAEVTLAAERRG
jgi:diguanylate cyclase (GGDEF)-like protein